MFLIESEGETMSVKPMNCPGHFLTYASEMRSYRDLPIRFHEQTPLHRNEASGVLSGLTRVRQFSQDDAHCFVTQEQIGDEVERLIRLVQRVYGDFDLPYTAKLSTRPDEFMGEVATWDHAEAQLKAALDGPGWPYTINEKDGAFYGPKIDFDITDAIGRKWQCATIQLDYQQPENFDLKYIGADNAEHRPIVIHRAILGSFERFIALLIEHYAGAFPFWVAPVQAIRAADCRPAPGLRAVGPSAADRCGSPRRAGRAAGKDWIIRSGKPSCRRFPICWWSATKRRRRGRLPCAAAPAEIRAPRRSRPSSRRHRPKSRRKKAA